MAIKRQTSVQEIINNTLAKGFGQISDIEVRRDTIKKIDRFRRSLANKKINVQSLVDQSKKELEIRTNRLLKTHL